MCEDSPELCFPDRCCGPVECCECLCNFWYYWCCCQGNLGSLLSLNSDGGEDSRSGGDYYADESSQVMAR